MVPHRPTHGHNFTSIRDDKKVIWYSGQLPKQGPPTTINRKLCQKEAAGPITLVDYPAAAAT
jgi:hypothetical protein